MGSLLLSTELACWDSDFLLLRLILETPGVPLSKLLELSLLYSQPKVLLTQWEDQLSQFPILPFSLRPLVLNEVEFTTLLVSMPETQLPQSRRIDQKESPKYWRQLPLVHHRVSAHQLIQPPREWEAKWSLLFQPPPPQLRPLLRFLLGSHFEPNFILGSAHWWRQDLNQIAHSHG